MKKNYISKNEYYRRNQQSRKGDGTSSTIYRETDKNSLTGPIIEKTDKVMKNGQVKNKSGGTRHHVDD